MTINNGQLTMEEKDKEIELRSEKVRNLIGEMPPFLIRWGNIILVVITILLGVGFWVAMKYVA